MSDELKAAMIAAVGQGAREAIDRMSLGPVTTRSEAVEAAKLWVTFYVAAMAGLEQARPSTEVNVDEGHVVYIEGYDAGADAGATDAGATEAGALREAVQVLVGAIDKACDYPWRRHVRATGADPVDKAWAAVLDALEGEE